MCIYFKIYYSANHSLKRKKHKVMKKQAVSHVFITFMTRK